MGYCLDCLDKPDLMVVAIALLTEFGIQHILKTELSILSGSKCKSEASDISCSKVKVQALEKCASC